MNKMYYIRKHGAYYGHDLKGYTSDFIYAGRYSEDEAKKECDHCSECSMSEIDMDEIKDEIKHRISQLKSLLP